MMSDEISDSSLKQVAQIFELKMDQLDEKVSDLKESLNKSDIKLNERLEKSDFHFDKRIDKLESKIEKREQDFNDQAINITKLQSDAKKTAGLFGFIMGLVGTIIAALVQRLMGSS